MQACPDPMNPVHSPLFSALGFGGSGSGRHGQGPSQRELRLLPVEQAWNSSLHCKRERERARTDHQNTGSTDSCLAFWEVAGTMAPRRQRWRRERLALSGFQNSNLGLVFRFLQNVPDNSQNTAESTGKLLLINRRLNCHHL